jgi:hypothetical protein
MPFVILHASFSPVCRIGFHHNTNSLIRGAELFSDGKDRHLAVILPSQPIKTVQNDFGDVVTVWLAG